MTIEEAKQYLRDNWEKGIICPCCGQYVRKYNIAFASSIAVFLIHLYKLNKINPGYHHVSKIIGSLKDGKLSMGHGWLQYWKLAESKENIEDSSKNKSGYWRITEKGQLFVKGEITIPSHAYIYNKKCYGFSDNLITIYQALRKKFDYQELMST